MDDMQDSHLGDVSHVKPILDDFFFFFSLVDFHSGSLV